MSVKPLPMTLPQFVQRLVAFLIVFTIVSIYTYAHFSQQPYAGFELAEDRIVSVHAADKGLEVGDRVIRVGDVLIADFNNDLFRTLCNGIRGGDTVVIEIERDKKFFTVNWKFPEAALNHLAFRFFVTHWWLAYIFIVMGGIVLWRIPLDDPHQQVLISFFFIMAILISASSVAWWHVWGGAVVFRSSIWIALPIALHLHWTFPKPLTPIPPSIKYLGYAAFILAAFAELFRLLPKDAYIIAFAVMMLSSLCMHGARLKVQKDQRRDTLLLFASLLLPSVSLGITSLITFFSKETPLILLTVGFYTLGIIPVAYTYVSNRHRPGNFEIQFNQLTTVILFAAAILLVAAIANEMFADFVGTLNFTGITPLFTFAGFFAGVMLTIYAFPYFKEIVEQRLLGIPISPTRIVESFASSVSRLSDAADLAQLLHTKIAPSLLIHRSALVLVEDQQPSPLYHSNVQVGDVPTHDEILEFLDRSPTDPLPFSPRLSWIQLILPIKHSDQLLGYWLLGSHGSKSVYDPAEIATLNALAHFTGIALSQVIQSKNLRALYQENIDRTEAYRAVISRELHDSMTQFKFLKEEIAKFNPPPEFFIRWDKAMSDIRHAVNDLRPKLLDFGVGPALLHLRDQLDEQSSSEIDITLNVKDDGDRYDLPAEQHIYHIIQQACQNALQHARATTITIRGRLEPRCVELTVEDNGIGFRFRGDSDVAAFVAQQQFGVAGMFERATILHASLTIDSAAGQGTRVHLKWQL